MNRARILVVLAVVATAVVAAAAREQKTPAGWKWRIQGDGKVVDAEQPKPGDTSFVTMAPGWHITSAAPTLLYHPDYLAKGNFSVEAEIFLFPGESQEEYGVFIGGKGLDPNDTPSYTSFVARRDGMGAVFRSSGTPIVAWKASEGVLPNPGKETVKNVLRVDALAAEIVFMANGKEVARIPRSGLNVDGHFGFRLGRDINLHASRLDVTYKLAPMPVK